MIDIILKKLNSVTMGGVSICIKSTLWISNYLISFSTKFPNLRKM